METLSGIFQRRRIIEASPRRCSEIVPLPQFLRGRYIRTLLIAVQNNRSKLRRAKITFLVPVIREKAIAVFAQSLEPPAA